MTASKASCTPVPCHPVMLPLCCCTLLLLQTLFSDVKLVLEALTNIPATRQRLIYRGRVLRDDSTLQEQGGCADLHPIAPHSPILGLLL